MKTGGIVVNVVGMWIVWIKDRSQRIKIICMNEEWREHRILHFSTASVACFLFEGLGHFFGTRQNIEKKMEV